MDIDLEIQKKYDLRDLEIQKKYDLSPEKYSPMDTQNVIPQARSSKKTSEPNQHNILATIPNQSSSLEM